MYNLQEVHINNLCGIADDCIKNINPKILDIIYNSKITDINHMGNLIKLNASGTCDINNYGIKNLYL